MPKGTPLYKTLSKSTFINLYKQEGSITGISRLTGYDCKSLRNLMQKYDIPFKYKTIYSHNDDSFSIDTEESFYWAGFIAADGCIKCRNKNTKILAIGLANKDEKHLVKLKNFLLAEEPVKKYINYSSIHIVSNKIAKDLERFNIVPRKTHVYKFPEWLIDHPMVNHFMRGYFDEDGGISLYTNLKRNRTIPQSIISVRGTLDFLQTFQSILITGVGEQNLNKNKIRLSNGIHILMYCGNNNGKKIFNFLYKDCKISLDRKYNLVKAYLQTNKI